MLGAGAGSWKKDGRMDSKIDDDRASGLLQRVIPSLGWLRKYRLGLLRADMIAGFTLAAYLLPAAIGDASLAGLSAENGLYACMFSGLIFWALCSSRHTTITVTSAISLLMGSSLGTIAGGDPSRYGALAACTAIMVAAISFIAWLVRAGAVVKFISETVLVGFKAGVAFYLGSTQLPKLCGISGTHGGSFWTRIWHFIVHLSDAHPASVMLGVGALAVLVLGKVLLKNKPVAIVVVVGGIASAALFNLGDHGVKLLGEVPQGLPRIGLPDVAWSDVDDLAMLALACFLLGAVETVAIGRTFAAKHGGRLDANQEFLALAGANLASGLGRGYPVSGGMSQSLVNESGGAKTPMSGLIAAGLILLVAVFFSATLKNLPQPVLAAIVLMAVVSLVKVKTLRHLWKTDRPEFFIAAAATLGVLGSGLLRGVLIGVVLSLVRLIHLASRPHVAFLGKIPGSRRYSDMQRHPDNEPTPGVLLFRTEGALLYFNADHVHDAVMARVRSTEEPPASVVCDLSTTPRIDIAGAELLAGLYRELKAMGVRFVLVEARSSVRDKLRLEGLEELVGRIDRFTTVADAVESLTSAGQLQPSMEQATA